MQKALIISDSAVMAHSLESEFGLAGWACDSLAVNRMLRLSSHSVQDYRCLALVVDGGFCRRFDNAIDDMCMLLRKLSQTIPLYLVFERDYDPIFSTWLSYSRRLFKATVKQPALKEAVREITRLEADHPANAAVVSPIV